MNARDEILGKLTRGEASTAPDVQTWSRRPVADLLSQFILNLESLGGRIAHLDDLLDLEDCWQDEDTLALLPQLHRSPDIWSAQTGITLAAKAIADTGSILIPNAPGNHRMASLLPPRHVVLIHESQIVPSLE